VALPVPEYGTENDEFEYKNPAMSVEEAFDVFNAAAPEGWRVELIEGEIHVTPPANGEHEEIVSEVTDQVALRRKDQRHRTYTGIGLFVPGASTTGKVIPDLVLAPKGSFADQDEYHDPASVLMVAEVTSSSTAGNDRVKKIRGYARAGIPVHLLIDREAEQAVLCTGPAGEDYTSKVSYKLSETIPLPEPLGFDLDTAEF
jgi:Uma2 family endonuclease